MPALTIRIMGALAVGILYQFYYGGGDTFVFHTDGSRQIWNAFWDSPISGLKLFFNDHNSHGIYKYSSQIYFYNDPSSFAVIQISTLFDLLTFSSYSGTAVCFSVVSFCGAWMFFLTFYRLYPHLHLRLAIAALFIPSVFFWGSGLLKDTLTLAGLGMVVYAIYQIFAEGRLRLGTAVMLLVALYLVYTIKIYILLAFIPAIVIWGFVRGLSTIHSLMLRILLAPLTLALAVGFAFFSVARAGEDNPKYALNKVAQTAQVTAYDIRFWSGRDAGSGYTLGTLDGTVNSMLRLAPAAVNVALFRPYFWEANNPLMFFSAAESFAVLLLVLYTVIKCNVRLFSTLTNPDVLLCLIFALIFSFGVGVSTFNFGTLARYKIPMLPFFLIALFLMQDQVKSRRKFDALEAVE